MSSHPLEQQNDINMICSEFDKKDKILRDIYTDATKQPLTFLKIVTGRCEPNKGFSKGFKKYYKIDDDDDK